MASKTLATMQSRIADEIGRDDLSAQILNAINDAISVYNTEPFYFNETREITFALNQGQDFYDDSDYPDIANILKIDYIFAIFGGNSNKLDPMEPAQIEALIGTGSQGTPSDYCWYGQKLRIYPQPATSGYSLRIGCVKIVPAPTDPDDTTSPWMNDAEMLIRSHAKYELARHVVFDDDLARRMGGTSLDIDGRPCGGAVGDALSALNKRTARITRIGSGYVKPMDF